MTVLKSQQSQKLPQNTGKIVFSSIFNVHSTIHILYIFSFMLPVISFENFQKVEMIILNFKIFVALHTFKKKFRCNIRIIPHCLEVRFFFYLNHASSSDFFLSHNTILHLDINFMLTEADHLLV